jgi:glycerophosphoryl diester phosphodiesterase
METTDNWFDKLLMKKRFYIIITLLFVGMFAYIFKWQHIIHWFDNEYVVNHELLGTYGDFIGGVLGTIFALISILILIRTFNQQRAVTEKNKEQIENQRFNDLFFELLRLYQSEISELCGTIVRERGNEKITINYNNKDFFDFEKELLQRAFKPTTSYEGNIRGAINLYMSFYIKHRTKVAACFRTLYRIYDLLDKSDLRGNIKNSYLKIIRAQLTDSELFFIRYNAMTYYGANFISYINKYNILKHLPAFELLEFKDWWKDLNKTERMGINIVFHNSTRLLRKILLRKGANMAFKPFDEHLKYKFEIRTTSNYEVKIILQIDYSNVNRTMEYRGFEKFTEKKVQALLDCYLKEVFLYSNFEKFNNEEDLEFYSEPIKIDGHITTINSGVRNKKAKALKVKQL